MNNATFKIAKEVKNFDIPFDLNEGALKDWLNSQLINDDVVKSIRNIYYLIVQLNKIHIPAKERMSFLKQVYQTIQHINVRIDKKIESIAFPLDEEESQLIEFIIWSKLALTRGFCFVAKTVDEQKIKVYCWYQALTLMAQAYLQMTAVYFMPSHGFWMLCYSIYSLAEKEGVLKAILLKKDSKKQSIDDLFKQIIVFSLANPYQFRSKDMATVFEVLEWYMSEVHINFGSNNFVFNLHIDCEPKVISQLDNYFMNASTRSIDIDNVAKQLYRDIKNRSIKSELIEGMDQVLLMRLVRSLSGIKTRKHKRIDETGVSKCLAGLDYLSSYLRVLNGEVKEKTPEKKPQDWALLVAEDEYVQQTRVMFKNELEHDKKLNNIFLSSAEMLEDSEVWDDVSSDRNKLIENIEESELEIINSSVKGYSLYWDNSKNRVRVGEVFGLISSDSLRLEIAIIRRIQQLESRGIQLGVEVIGFESESAYVSRLSDRKNGNWNIFLPKVKGIKEHDSLVYKTGGYEIGCYILIERNKLIKKYQLSRLINLTQAISHAELLFIEDDF